MYNQHSTSESVISKGAEHLHPSTDLVCLERKLGLETHDTISLYSQELPLNGPLVFQEERRKVPNFGRGFQPDPETGVPDEYQRDGKSLPRAEVVSELAKVEVCGTVRLAAK